MSRPTGLTRGAIGQIRRAERAVELPCHGASPTDVAGQAGYADQPYLTRSPRIFAERTPSRVAVSASGV